MSIDRPDILVLVALKEELDAFLNVTEGVSSGWAHLEGDVPLHAGILEGRNGPLRVVAGRLTRMGGVATATVAIRLVDAVNPKCIAMCGVCAGHPDDTDLGDVVIGDRVFQHDEGKVKGDGFQGDLWVDALRDDWLRSAQELAGTANGIHGYGEPNVEAWKWWFLERLLAGRDPMKSAFQRYFPDSERAMRLQALRTERLVSLKDGLFSLSSSGRRLIQERLAFYGIRASDLPFHVHIGPIGSGNAVEASGALWGRLADSGMRKTLAVDMEAATIGRVAHERGLPFAVAKGVMDHADTYKADRFKPFAARASAEVLCRFLRSVAMPRPPGSAQDDVSPSQRSFRGLEKLPKETRERLQSVDDDPLTSLCRDLDQMILAESALSPVSDPAWPKPKRWAIQAAQALQEEMAALPAEGRLTTAELAVALALLLLVSTLFTQQAKKASSSQDLNDLLAKLHLGAFLEKGSNALDLPEKEVLMRWATSRFLHQERRKWSDATVLSHEAQNEIVNSLCSSPYTASVVRAAGGRSEQFEQIPEIGSFHYVGHSFQVRWKLLTCLLALSETKVIGLHLFSNEAIQNILQLPEAANAIKEQLLTTNIISDREGNWRVHATCYEPAFDFALSDAAQAIDTELRNHRARLSDYFTTITRRGFPSVGTDIHIGAIDGTPRYTKPHVRFSLSSEHARRLFMGTDLWGDPAFAFRELFQNALDACRYRIAQCKSLGLDYTPRIRMHHGRNAIGQEYVECEDNGIGMDRSLISSCFASAGNRFADTDEFRRDLERWSAAGVSMYPNSRFGIGVFSYFLVSDRLEVETARLGSAGGSPGQRHLMHIPTASSFFRVIAISEEEARENMRRRLHERGDPTLATIDAGTCVRLFLRQKTEETQVGSPSVATCYDAIRKYVWFSEVTTVVSDYLGRGFSLKSNSLAPWLEAVESGPEEPKLWWVSHPGEKLENPPTPEVAKTFRGAKRERPTSPISFNHPGRVLVDGIATDITTPGFIINLTGPHTPDLSIDRRTIRSDISDVLQNRARKAISFIPEELAPRLIPDLWMWDTQICHDLRVRYMRHCKDLHVCHSSTIHRSFFPSNDSVLSSLSPYTKTLIRLWRLARSMPDARLQPRFILENRGVDADASKLHLAKVPLRVWQKWSETDLGIPECAVFEYGVEMGDSTAHCLYASWRSGESLETCIGHAKSVTELLGRPWSQPHFSSGNLSITDVGAWLLGRGALLPPWIGKEITTVDVLVLANRHKTWSIAYSVQRYRGLISVLGIKDSIDDSLLNDVGLLSDEEALDFRMLAHGFDFRTMRPHSERLIILRRLADAHFPAADQTPNSRSAPPRPPSSYFPDSVISAETSEGRKVISRRLQDSTSSDASTLEAICELARTLERPILELVEDVQWALEQLGKAPVWGDEEILLVSDFGDADWCLLEVKPDFFSSRRVIKARSRRGLAARIAWNSFRFSQATPVALHDRIKQLYNLFKWGDPPTSVSDIELALSWDYSDGRVVEEAPDSGVFSLASLIAFSAHEGKTLHEALTWLRRFEPLGFLLPTPEDTYMGISLDSLLRDEELDASPT